MHDVTRVDIVNALAGAKPPEKSITMSNLKFMCYVLSINLIFQVGWSGEIYWFLRESWILDMRMLGVIYLCMASFRHVGSESPAFGGNPTRFVSNNIDYKIDYN